MGCVGGVPVAGVLDHGYVVIGHPLLEGEGARANHALALALGVVVVLERRGVRLVLLERGRALNAEDLEGLAQQEVGRRRLEGKDDARVTRGSNGNHVGVRTVATKDGAVVVGVVLKVALRIGLPAVVVELHGRSVERGPVLELDACSQRERVHLAVGADRRQGRGEDRDHFADRAGLEADKALNHLGRDVQRVAVANERRIRVGHVAVEADDEVSAVDRSCLRHCRRGRCRGRRRRVARRPGRCRDRRS